MRYYRVRWIHEFMDEPLDLYSEVDEDGWEQRKVEIFRDGRMGYAEATAHSLSTELSEKVLPSLEEIAADPQFQPSEITQAAFEEVWQRARSQ